MEKHFMLGKVINNVLIAKDKHALLFKCADGDHEAWVDADCCSTTWIEGVELPAAGYPATVTGVEELDLPEYWENGDCIRPYGLRLATDKGLIIIDFRNSSNGYYGGSLEFPNTHKRHYGGVYGQAVSTKEWQEIKE